MSPTPPPSQTVIVRWHCIAESKRRVAEIKSFSVIAQLMEFRKATEFRKVSSDQFMCCAKDTRTDNSRQGWTVGHPSPSRWFVCQLI